MSYVVIVNNKVEFQSERVLEAIQFQAKRKAGVLAKVLEVSYTADELDVIGKFKMPSEQPTK